MKSIKYLLTKERHYLKNELSEDFTNEVGKICSEYLAGEWTKANKDSITIQRIAGGNTNHVFKISLCDSNENPVLLRIYGTDCEEEIFKDTLLFSILSEKKLGPKFLGYFPGGRLEEFIESRSLTTEELGYPSTLKVLAKKVACIHSLEIPLPKKSQIFEMIRNELKKIEDATTPNYFIKIEKTKVFNLKHPTGVSIRQLEEEVKLIEDSVKQFNFNIVFSHNDIFEGNIIIRNDAKIERNKIISDDENNSIIIIDYEYSCYNYRGFDFGQIFCEMAISYDTIYENGYDINQEMIAENERLLTFINEYLNEMYKINNVVTNEEQFKNDVSQLLLESKIFIQIVNLYWGVWNIRQGLISTLNTYDFMLHGLDRLALYYDKQHELLNTIMIRIDEVEPEGYEWYKEQIAGHHPSVIKGDQKQIGLLKKKNGKNVLKVVQDGMKGELEVQFYNSLFNQDVPESLKLLKSFVPEYFGIHDIKFSDKTFSFIELADIAEEYKLPCQMDVKIGIKTFDPQASKKKQENESKKYSPQIILGFRILGYRLNLIDNRNENKINLIAKDRVWGRSFDENNISIGLNEFFIQNPLDFKNYLLENFLKQLKTLLSWFKVQTNYHFYASSLLFVYEGNAKVKEELKPTIKMIDFSHTYPGDGQLDENYIPGLQNIIELFEKCLNVVN